MELAVPLYYRIANHIRNRIMAGIYAPGEKIPSENELCEQFEISRITVRQALKVLETQGMLIRKQGIGTIVNEKIDLQPINFNGYIEDIVFQLLSARLTWCEINEVVPDKEIKDILKLPEDTDSVVKVERIRAVDTDINSYAINFLPVQVGRMLTEEHLSKHSLIELIDHGESTIKEATQVIMAKAADETIAEKLRIKPGNPVLFSEYLMFNQQKHPINLARVYYHADHYKYTVQMGRLKS